MPRKAKGAPAIPPAPPDAGPLTALTLNAFGAKEADMAVRKDTITKFANALDATARTITAAGSAAYANLICKKIMQVLRTEITGNSAAEAIPGQQAVRTAATPALTANTVTKTIAPPVPAPVMPIRTTTTAPKSDSWAARAAAALSSTPAKPKQKPEATTRRVVPRATGPHADKRLFARIPPHALNRLGGIQNVRHALRGAGIDDKHTAKCDIVATGIALTPTDDVARRLLLEKAELICCTLNATSLDEAEVWHTYLVKQVPIAIGGYLEAAKNIDDKMVADEALIQTGRSPCSSRMVAKVESSGSRSWLLSFRQPVDQFRLFDASAPSRELEKKRQIMQCQQCWGFHPDRHCDRNRRCGRCAHDSHEHQCAIPPRCTNCLGPHPADDPACPARPRRQNGQVTRLTKRQSQAVRAAGSALWAKKNPTIKVVARKTAVTSVVSAGAAVEEATATTTTLGTTSPVLTADDDVMDTSEPEPSEPVISRKRKNSEVYVDYVVVPKPAAPLEEHHSDIEL